MRKSRFSIVQKDIEIFFHNHTTHGLTHENISDILYINNKKWKLPKNLGKFKFIKLLIEHKIVEKVTITFPHRKIIRYATKPNRAPLCIASTISPKAYFSHSSALYIHNLIKKLPKMIYLNIEQQPHHANKNNLLQRNIDFAFKNKQKVSNNIAKFNNHQICLLNGKHTENLDVIIKSLPEIGNINVTSIERSLIDIVVRPVYGGGVQQILIAYKNAMHHISLEKLKEILIKLDYTYPYHQAIGYYLDRTNKYTTKDLEIFKDLGLYHDFYLAHKMSKTKYSKEWRIHYPSDL